MNSKLLEEAIIDAEALREAALKNAEQAILEKYAPEVKSAIQSLLEQDEPMPAAAMPPLGGDISAQEKPEMDVPLAATDGEKLCPCPDDDEVVTISIGDLEKAISDIARANSVPQEEPAMDMGMDMGAEMPPEEPALPGEEELPPEEEAPLAENLDITEELIASILAESDELEEMIELEESEENEELDEAYPKRSYDRYGVQKGHTSADDEIESRQLRMAREKAAATAAEKAKEKAAKNESLEKQNSKMLVENKKVLNENKLLTEKLEKLLKVHNGLLEESKKVKETALELSRRLEESNLLNAKLHYKNQALGSDSLNERQKTKIVEAVSKADSVDEAKMIYETLCNAVGSFDSKGPKSLNEAVEKKGGMVIKPRQETNSNTNPVYNKWQKIAGIKK